MHPHGAPTCAPGHPQHTGFEAAASDAVDGMRLQGEGLRAEASTAQAALEAADMAGVIWAGLNWAGATLGAYKATAAVRQGDRERLCWGTGRHLLQGTCLVYRVQSLCTWVLLQLLECTEQR